MAKETKRQEVILEEPIICPVCHQEHKGKGQHVDHEAGDAICCSEACAKMFEAHCDMPADKRQTLA